MSLKVYIRPEAEAGLEDAGAWYEQQREGLGQEFLDEVLKYIRNNFRESEHVPCYT